jgi:hypothetical protein
MSVKPNGNREVRTYGKPDGLERALDGGHGSVVSVHEADLKSTYYTSGVMTYRPFRPENASGPPCYFRDEGCAAKRCERRSSKETL